MAADAAPGGRDRAGRGPADVPAVGRGPGAPVQRGLPRRPGRARGRIRTALGRPVAQAWPELWSGFGARLREAQRGQGCQVRDLPLEVVREGVAQRAWLDVSATPVRDESGAVGGVLLCCADTTVRVLAQRERDAALCTVEGNARFRTFFDQGASFAALLTLDGAVVDVNRVSLEVGSYERADVVGRYFWDCGWWTPSDELVARVRDCVGRAAQGETVSVEMAYFVGDGSRRFTRMTVTPVTDDDGRPVFIAATGNDITEQRQVEARLRLLDSIGEATRVASDPKVIMEEATRLLGEHLGVTRVAYADLEADNDRFTIRHDWRVPGAISTVGVYSLDLFGSRARNNLRAGRNLVINDVDRELAPEDGKDMFNQIAIKAIVCCGLAKGGRLVAMMAVHQEHPRAWSAEEVALIDAVVERCWAHIERVRSTEALREADRHKSEFLATLAHELRNPLAPIRNGLDLLRLNESRPGAVSVSAVRDMMDRQLRHMTHLVNDLLDMARVSSGKIVLQPEQGILQDIVTAAVEASMPLLETAGHVVALELPEAPVPVLADPVRLSQVIGNLLSNAAKYTPQGGRIRLSMRLDGGCAVIAVADDGIGIPAESLGAVFDMFTQVARHIDRSNGGLGIGLALVRRLVELHGGTVSAASPGPGQGSTFTIRLPLAAAHALRQAPAAAPARPGRSLRVLVADDNGDAASTLATLLVAEGHEVRVAGDGVEALTTAAAFRPHLAILDIGMPVMDGYEAARRMRALPELAGVRLAALTGWGAAEDRSRSRAAGFEFHLLKPAGMAEIEAVLAAAGAAVEDQSA